MFQTLHDIGYTSVVADELRARLQYDTDFYRSIFLFPLSLLPIRFKQTEFTMNDLFSFVFFRISVRLRCELLRFSSLFSFSIRTKVKAMTGRPLQEEILFKRMQGWRQTSRRTISRPSLSLFPFQIMTICVH